jgi:hypothetical protein
LDLSGSMCGVRFVLGGMMVLGVGYGVVMVDNSLTGSILTGRVR